LPTLSRRIQTHIIQTHILALVIVESLAFLCSPFLAALARYRGSLDDVHRFVGPLSPIALIFTLMMLLTMMAMGLYSRRQRARSLGIVMRIFIAAFGAFVLSVFVIYLDPELFIGRGVMAITALIAASGALIAHFLFDRLCADDAFRRRVLVFGAGRRALPLRQLRRRADQRGFKIVGFVLCPGDICDDASVRLVDPGRHIQAYCRANHIDEIVVAMDDRRIGFPVDQVLRCKMQGVQISDVIDFLERETLRLRLDVMNPGWLIFSGGFRSGPIMDIAQRFCDLAASMLLLAATWPVMIATVVAIKLEDGLDAPVLYRQERVGQDGKVFAVLKFRSMRIDAERPGEPRWAQKRDPRVTRVGAVIRNLRVDELPQIINALRGEMSLVGPRPERPEFVAKLAQEIPYYAERHTVKPGITGWAQLCYPYGSTVQDAAQKLQYDLFYIKNRSIVFNLMVLLVTVEVIFFGKGAR
jgi:sugar transferase (PEP-CTERM system associated)